MIIQKISTIWKCGWPAKVFFGFYALLEEDLLRVIEDSRNYGRILFNLNIVNWL